MYWRQLDLRVWREVLSGSKEAIYNTFENKFCSDVLMSWVAPPIISRKTESFKDIWNNQMTSSFISENFQQQRRQNPRFLVVPSSSGPGRSRLAGDLSSRPRPDNVPAIAMSRHRPGAGESRAGPCPELPIVSLSVEVTVRESRDCEALRVRWGDMKMMMKVKLKWAANDSVPQCGALLKVSRQILEHHVLSKVFNMFHNTLLPPRR